MKKQFNHSSRIFSGLALLSLSLWASLCYANSSTGLTKATATLNATCQITAQNVNFGQLNLQTAAGGVSASSNIGVTCTKGSAYTVGLAYGGVYGQGTAANGDYYVFYSQVPSGGTFRNIYYEYNGQGQQINYIGVTLTAQNPQGLPPDSTLTSGHGETSGSIYTVQGGGYSYGIMTGVISGDTIGYSISVPGNPSQIWNAGENSYSSTGTGALQTLPVNVTAQTGTHGPTYPTPDTYMDTVTATINF